MEKEIQEEKKKEGKKKAVEGGKGESRESCVKGDKEEKREHSTLHFSFLYLLPGSLQTLHSFCNTE